MSFIKTPFGSDKSGKDEQTSRRKKRSDAGAVLMTPRDQMALSWIGQQYGMSIDQLQRLLGQQPGRGAVHERWISESAARETVTRWKKAGWVQAGRTWVDEPLWVWLTPLGLSKMGFSYQSRDFLHMNRGKLRRLYEFNEIRLHLDHGQGKWRSEWQLLQEVNPHKSHQPLHLPDAEMHDGDGKTIAVQVELSKKKLGLEERMRDLLLRSRYLALCAECEWESRYDENCLYTQIYYFAPKSVRQLIYQVRAKLVKAGEISGQDAERLVVRWYPLVRSTEELEQEEREDRQARLDPKVLDGSDDLFDDGGDD